MGEKTRFPQTDVMVHLISQKYILILKYNTPQLPDFLQVKVMSCLCPSTRPEGILVVWCKADNVCG